MNPWRTWWALPRSLKWLVCEATLFLLLAWLGRLTLPYAKVIRLFGLRKCDLPQEDPLTSPVAETVAAVSRAVDIGARYLVRPGVCLERALAAAKLLSRRGVRSVLFLGVFRGPKGLASHAWLKVGTTFVTGQRGSANLEIMICYT